MAAAIEPLATTSSHSRVESSQSRAADAATVRRVLDGDRQAFEEIVFAHEHSVYRIARRILGNREDAEDVAQEVFAAAFTNLGSFDSRQPLRPWIARITVNTAISYRRRRQPTTTLEDQWHSSKRPSPREEAEADQRHEQLDRAVAQLPEASREAVALFYGEEMKIDDVARTLGRQPGAVKVALHRARLRLREIVFGNADRRDGE